MEKTAICEKRNFYRLTTAGIGLILAYLLFNPNENFISFFRRQPAGAAMLLLAFGTGFIFFSVKIDPPGTGHYYFRRRYFTAWPWIFHLG